MMLSETTRNKPDIYFIIITLVGVALPLLLLCASSPSPLVGNDFVQGSDASLCDSKVFICINHATKAELMVLSGIGEVKAEAIIDYRNTNGFFTTKDEIMLVEGIGPKIFEGIYDVITL